MSRIIQSIIKNAFNNEIKNAIIFSNPNNLNFSIENMNLYSFDDTNKFIKISLEAINNSISTLPDIVICSWLMKYQDAKNLASVLRLPLINLIFEDSLNIKKEAALHLASAYLINDINLVSNKDIAKSLFITNYNIIDDLEKQINELTNLWIIK